MQKHIGILSKVSHLGGKLNMAEIYITLGPDTMYFTYYHWGYTNYGCSNLEMKEGILETQSTSIVELKM